MADDTPQADSALTIAQLQYICDVLEWRIENVVEPLRDSLGVVLFNLGDAYTQVRCIAGEWRGEKRELPPSGGGIPKCPNGHVLTEHGRRLQLGWVANA